MSYRILATLAYAFCFFHPISAADTSTVEVTLNSFELLIELPNPGIRYKIPVHSEFYTRLHFTIKNPKEKEGREVELLVFLAFNNPPEIQKLNSEEEYWKKRVGKSYKLPKRLHKAALHSPFRSRLYIDKDSLIEVKDYTNKTVKAPCQSFLAITLTSL